MRFLKLFLLFLSVTSYSQINEYKSTGLIEVGTHGVDLGYNFLIGNKLFLNLESGIGAGYNVNDNAAAFVFNFSKPTLYVKSGFSYLYNKEKRISNDKTIANNSGNFISLQLKYSFGNDNDIDLNKSLLSEINWGIQRSLGSNFYFRTHVGFGYLHDFDYKDGNFTPTLGIKFGYILL